MVSKLKSLKEHQGFMKYFKNTSWLFFEKVLRMIVGLFVGIWVARYLGPEQFGVFSYAQSFVGLFIAISMMGLNSLLVKEIVEKKFSVNEVMGTGFFLKLLGAIIVFILLYIAVLFTDNDKDVNIYIFIIASSLVLQSFNVIEFYFQSQIISRYIVYSNLISLLLSSVLKIIFILYQMNLIWFVILTVVDTFILILGFIYFYKKNNYSIKTWKFNSQLAWKFLHQGWPLILSGMSFVVYNNIDKIMLQNMINAEAVGVYTAATRLVMVWHFLPGLIVTSLMPAMVEAYTDNNNFIQKLQYMTSFLVWIALIITIVYVLFSNFILNITFGEEFIKSTDVLSVLVWSNIFIFFNTIWNRWQLLKGNTKITFYFSLVTSILNIFFNYFLINQFGIVGASYSIIISLAISSIIFYIILDFQVIKLFFRALLFIKVKG